MALAIYRRRGGDVPIRWSGPDVRTIDADGPTGLSAWAFKPIGKPADDGEFRRIALPTVVLDGVTTRFQVMAFAVGGVEVHLVYHPDWEIDHPLEREHRAVRLWPRHRPVRLISLPCLASNVDRCAGAEGRRCFSGPARPLEGFHRYRRTTMASSLPARGLPRDLSQLSCDGRRVVGIPGRRRPLARWVERMTR